MADDLHQRALMQAMARDEPTQRPAPQPMPTEIEEFVCPQCKFRGSKDAFMKEDTDFEYESPDDEESGEPIENVLRSNLPRNQDLA